MTSFYSTGQVAKRFGVDRWRIRRLFECGAVPEVGRLAGKRVIPADRLAKIKSALKARGWLEATEAAHAD